MYEHVGTGIFKVPGNIEIPSYMRMGRESVRALHGRPP